MIHYFVQNNGMEIDEVDLVKGVYSKDVNPNMHLTRRGAVKAAVKELSSHVRDCEEQLRIWVKGEKG